MKILFSYNLIRNILFYNQSIKLPKEINSIKISNIGDGHINISEWDKCGKINGVNTIILCSNNHNGIYYNVNENKLLSIFPDLQTIMFADNFHFQDLSFMSNKYNYLIPKYINTFMYPHKDKILKINNYSEIVDNINHIIRLDDPRIYRKRPYLD